MDRDVIEQKVESLRRCHAIAARHMNDFVAFATAVVDSTGI